MSWHNRGGETTQSPELGGLLPPFSHPGVRASAPESSDHLYLSGEAACFSPGPPTLRGSPWALAASQASLLFPSFLSCKMGLARGPRAGCCRLPPPFCSGPLSDPLGHRSCSSPLLQVILLLGPLINQIWKIEADSISVRRQIGKLGLRKKNDLPEVAQMLVGELDQNPESWVMCPHWG